MALRHQGRLLPRRQDLLDLADTDSTNRYITHEQHRRGLETDTALRRGAESRRLAGAEPR